jgi:hypothetical protein
VVEGITAILLEWARAFTYLKVRATLLPFFRSKDILFRAPRLSQDAQNFPEGTVARNMEQCRRLRAACLSSAPSVVLFGRLTTRRVHAAFSSQEEDLAMLHIYILRASGCLIQYLLFGTQSPNFKAPVDLPISTAACRKALKAWEEEHMKDEHTMIAEVHHADRLDRHQLTLLRR